MGKQITSLDTLSSIAESTVVALQRTDDFKTGKVPLSVLRSFLSGDSSGLLNGGLQLDGDFNNWNRGITSRSASSAGYLTDVGYASPDANMTIERRTSSTDQKLYSLRFFNTAVATVAAGDYNEHFRGKYPVGIPLSIIIRATSSNSANELKCNVYSEATPGTYTAGQTIATDDYYDYRFDVGSISSSSAYGYFGIRADYVAASSTITIDSFRVVPTALLPTTGLPDGIFKPENPAMSALLCSQYYYVLGHSDTSYNAYLAPGYHVASQKSMFSINTPLRMVKDPTPGYQNIKVYNYGGYSASYGITGIDSAIRGVNGTTAIKVIVSHAASLGNGVSCNLGADLKTTARLIFDATT